MNPFTSPGQAALAGAVVAFAAALLYGMIFALLATLRATHRIRQGMPPDERPALLYLANATSIFITSLELSIGLGMLAAILQGLAWLVAVGLSAVLPAPVLPVALVIALLLVAGLHLTLRRAPDLLYAMLWRSWVAYVFWLGLPCLIFLLMTVAVFG